MVQRGAIKLQYVSTDEQVVDVLQYVSTDEQVADVLTKPLSRVKFEHFRDKLGVVCKDLPQKGE
jgi:hypothetical protein